MHYPINWLVVFSTALVPLLVGSVWFHPKVFGNALQTSNVLYSKKNAVLLLFVSLILSLFISISLLFSVVHQLHIFSVVMGNPDMQNPSSELSLMLQSFIEKYGTNFRTFKHGALHGTIVGFSLALPITAINAMLEKKSFKHIALVAAFWIICFCLMGGIICQFV